MNREINVRILVFALEQAKYRVKSRGEQASRSAAAKRRELGGNTDNYELGHEEGACLGYRAAENLLDNLINAITSDARES